MGDDASGFRGDIETGECEGAAGGPRAPHSAKQND